MALKTLQLDIVSLEGKIFSGVVAFVCCTGKLGELGIFPGHTPLLSPIKPGFVRYQMVGEAEEVKYISGGILEVQPEGVAILADTIIRAEDLDEAAALEAYEKASSALQSKAGDIDFEKVTSDLAQASAQIHAIAEFRKKLKH